MRDELSHLSWDDWDEHHDPRPDTHEFDAVVAEGLSRRGVLSGLVAFGSGAAVMGLGALKGTSALAAGHSSRFAFTPIPIATDGTVHVPQGYSWQVLAAWGDPLFSDAEGAFTQDGAVPVEVSDRVFGENNDGMELFNIDGHEVIAVNHEYVNPDVNFPNRDGEAAFTADQVTTMQNTQGVTVMEVSRDDDGQWSLVVDSPFNRRITHRTEMRIAGPAAGHPLLQTADDPTGTVARGTHNNCAVGRTPWGTYLTCEENFNGYFGSSDEAFERTDGMRRYGINLEGRYGYELHDARYDISQNPNEPNRHGWVVEIDPSDPQSTPVKHTGLGRIKHENAAVAVAPDGRIVVYLGDDERGEYLYRFVSDGVYAPGVDTEPLLNEGTLYVAKFQADGTGNWLPLTPETTGMEAAEILIHTRMAASAAGGTTMDRPEWVAVNPVAAEAYCCLTNNSRRGVLNDDGTVRTNAGGDAMTINAANPRAENNYGQVVRWFPANDDHATDAFRWDLYVMAGNPDVATGAYAGSANVNSGNLFNSPDGLMFDSSGLLWIETDGNDSNEGDFAGMGNNQMLAGDPVTGEIQRFLTGPKGSEVTGITWSSDKRTMFVGIQHPASPFPDGEGTLGRSAVIAITRDDGAPVG